MATTEEEKPPLQNPTVFINFRGVELRQSFIAHLEIALKNEGVNVFVQAEQSIRGVFLFKGIEESSIALVIFSKRYTESSWCLNELVEIEQRVKQRKLVAIPIFYKVDPSEVKNLEGEFGLNLWNHVKSTCELDKFKNWKEALESISQMSGLVYTEQSSEMEFVNDIVKRVKEIADSVHSQVKLPQEKFGKYDDFLGEANSELEHDTEEKPLQNPQVFINFRGVDLGQSFVDHLEKALKREGVNVYGQAEQSIPGVGLDCTFKGIEESSIALVIFTERYTESSWCLDQLVWIKRRVEQGKLVVIPIFYKVSPSVVGSLDGDFGLNLWNHVKHTSEFDMLKRWKEALDFVLQKRGLMFKEKSELEFVRAIVTMVLVAKHKADRVHTEVKFPGKFRKGDDFLGETNSDATSKSQHNTEINKIDPVNEEKGQENVCKSSVVMTHNEHPPQHQVFINFRGEELRNGFVSHLSVALESEGFNVFINGNDTRGQDLRILLSRIEESKIALVIFSRSYTESRSCLDELLKIKELVDEGKLIAIPIYYRVQLSEVAELKGEFGHNFWNLWRINRDHHIIKWKEALNSVTRRKGYRGKNLSPQSIALNIKDSIEYISEQEGEKPSLEERKSAKLPMGKGEKDETYLDMCQCHPFGIEQRMEQLENKLEFHCSDTRIIGVVGMPGSGKTTLVTMLYKKWNGRFTRCVPLMDIRKKSEDYGLVWLRKTLLEVLLEGKCQELSDETTHGSVKVELLNNKIFAVLDDVSDKKQLEFLLSDLEWIKMGSRIVITTCDKSLLEGLAHDTYVVPELNDREAFELFSYQAFDDQICSPTGTLLTLSRMFVDYARGHPLALNMLGRELWGKDKTHWQYKLETVTDKSSMMFQYVWRLSTNQLNEKQKDVFLDIVCFFSSEDDYFVRSLLDSEDPDFTDAVSEVKALANKFLITISDNQVHVNDLLYMFGKDLDSPQWLRLWNYEDIIDDLKTMNISDADKVRGIFLDMSKLTKSICLYKSTFVDMSNLRYLKIYDSYCPWQCKADCKFYILEGLKLPLAEVRYFHWVKFPLEELPPDFRTGNLVDLRLPYSQIKRVWEGDKGTPCLKWVDLRHSSKLLDLSAFSRAENLQSLNLEGCTSLVELPVEIHCMKSLIFLNLRGCICLSYLPEMNLVSLKTLILSGCVNLEEFQLISENLEVLHLDGTAIKELPPAIRMLQRLTILNLKNCKMLEYLPNCLGELKALEELMLSGCSRLQNLSDVTESMKHLQSLLIDKIGAKEMPDIFSVTKSEDQAFADMFVHIGPSKGPDGHSGVSLLQRLSLSENDFISLHTDIGKLYNLKWLDVKQCKKLRSVPMLPPRLQYFDANGCDSLERVANPLALSMFSEQIHGTFNFSNCNKLDQDAKDSIISYTRCRSQLVLDKLTRYNGDFVLEALTGTCFPGRDIPTWFSHQANGSVVSEPKLPPQWCGNQFTGIALCVVLLNPGYHEQMNRLLVKCSCVFNNKDGGSCIRFSCTIGSWSEPSRTPGGDIEQSHVFIGYTSMLDIKKHGEEEDTKGCSHTEASFEFQVTDGTEVLEGCKVVKCGFSFVYAIDGRENICRDANTIVIPERIENIPGDYAIQYDSYSGLTLGRSQPSSSVEKSGGRVEMHDQMRTLGKDLASPGRQRLWNYIDIIDKLTKMKQPEASNVRGIFLDMSEITKSISLYSSTFINMHNLLYLKIYDCCCKADCNLYFPDGFEFPLEEVRYLHWMHFPLKQLPSDFRPENLVDLRLPYSQIERVWEGVKDTPRLMRVDLSHSSKLLDLSALSKAAQLKKLNLEGCTSLHKLPVEIQKMKSLVFLNMRGCIRLMSFPEIGLISLKTLILSECSNLKEFRLISERLEVLHLDGTAIKRLPETIQNLQRLVVLNLKNCKMLECLPDCLGNLKALDELILSGCSRLKDLPNVRNIFKHLQILLLDGTSCFTGFEGPASPDMQPIISHSSVREWPLGVNGVSSLRRLCLSGNDFVSLQPDIGKLYNLNWLDVKQCKKLRFVPTLPPRLMYFDAHGCDSLERVANPLAFPVLADQIHATFNFSNCKNLDQDAKDNIISYTRCRSQLVLDELTRYNGGLVEALIGTCFPGWKVPALFSHRASGSVLKAMLPPHWCDNKFTGIGLCAVIVFNGYHNNEKRVEVKCNCEFKNKVKSSFQFSCTVGGWSKPSTPLEIESSHVFIGFTSRLLINKISEEDIEEKCLWTETSIEFEVIDGTEEIEGCKVVKCGFSLVYAPREMFEGLTDENMQRLREKLAAEIFDEVPEPKYTNDLIPKYINDPVPGEDDNNVVEEITNRKK